MGNDCMVVNPNDERTCDNCGHAYQIGITGICYWCQSDGTVGGRKRIIHKLRAEGRPEWVDVRDFWDEMNDFCRIYNNNGGKMYIELDEPSDCVQCGSQATEFTWGKRGRYCLRCERYMDIRFGGIDVYEFLLHKRNKAWTKLDIDTRIARTRVNMDWAAKLLVEAEDRSYEDIHKDVFKMLDNVKKEDRTMVSLLEEKARLLCKGLEDFLRSDKLWDKENDRTYRARWAGINAVLQEAEGIRLSIGERIKKERDDGAE